MNSCEDALTFYRQSQRVDEKREHGVSSCSYLTKVIEMLYKRELCRDRTTWNSSQLPQEQLILCWCRGTEPVSELRLFSPHQAPPSASC